MAVTRLNDSQKAELVARFRAGEGSQALASAYGCSAATVTRTVRAALDPAEYDRLKQSGGRRGTGQQTLGQQALELAPEPEGAPEPDASSPASLASKPVAPAALERDSDLGEDAPGVLALEDADDFGDDNEDDDGIAGDTDDAEDDSEESEYGDDDDLDDLEDLDDLDDLDDDASVEGDGEDSEGESAHGLKRLPRGSRSHAAAALAALDGAGRPGPPVETRPLEEASLPASAYMLVDKTVELQARPLSEFPELGLLEAEELARQALVVFGNPRQAKRQCGRSQRVIKIPDTSVFVRTSRFLLSQGISRVVIEGALYSLPGS